VAGLRSAGLADRAASLRQFEGMGASCLLLCLCWSLDLYTIACSDSASFWHRSTCLSGGLCAVPWFGDSLGGSCRSCYSLRIPTPALPALLCVLPWPLLAVPLPTPFCFRISIEVPCLVPMMIIQPMPLNVHPALIRGPRIVPRGWRPRSVVLCLVLYIQPHTTAPDAQ